ncbi:MAG: hypothetical protein ACOCXQ_03510 [Patescibacteria group bacterium]
MKRPMMCGIFALLTTTVLLLPMITQATSFTISSDPQYLIVNLADPKERYDWNVSQDTWNQTVRPVIIEELNQLKSDLGTGTDKRRLAWSIIVTYNEFPLDTPSMNSPYVTYVERILDIAESEDMPVFIPLNGYQWWNQLPELYNYWDPDGMQTPGCTNDNFANCPFPELQDEDFRQRFIAGFNPDNRYNVEWQSWEEPLPLNTRDWGGGPFQHAPNPNLVDHPHTELSFVDVQRARTAVIIRTIVDRVSKWEEAGKGHLFAGVSIGTEISLNATINPDDPFIPYGYRGIQDISCPTEEPTCLQDNVFSREELNRLRQQIVSEYLLDLSYRAVRSGLPKQRIYTHVWSEVQPDDTERYVDYFGAAINHYSRPGMSNYVHTTIPFSLKSLDEGLASYGEPYWGVPEFSAADDSWEKALTRTMANDRNPAQIINIYNKREIWDGPAVPAIRNFLATEHLTESCRLDPIIIENRQRLDNPNQLSWKRIKTNLTDTQKNKTEEQTVVELYRYYIPGKDDSPDYQKEVNSNATSMKLPLTDLDPGLYHWIVRTAGCDGEAEVTSTPGMLVVSNHNKLNPWEKFWLALPTMQ